MMRMKKIVVDIYGADAGPIPIIQGIADAMGEIEELHPVFAGSQRLVRETLGALGVDEKCYTVLDTEEFVSMEDDPSTVFSGREKTSLVMALNYLKEHTDCTAMLSPGNTGALLVGAIVHLGMLPGVKKPVLCSALPCSGRELLCLVDCGANIDCKPKDLLQFARMGSTFIAALCGMDNPRVGLMSVGREDCKGNALTLETARLLWESSLNFVGNLEGSDMITDYADVIVTDGFMGNVILKNTEAVGLQAAQLVEELLEKVPQEQKPTLVELREELFRRYAFNSRGGATFLGPKKPIIKMHGCANRYTAHACVLQALRLEKAGFIPALEQAIQ